MVRGLPRGVPVACVVAGGGITAVLTVAGDVYAFGSGYKGGLAAFGVADGAVAAWCGSWRRHRQ